jgi:hypothetical protein
MDALLQVEVVETGAMVWLPRDIAERWARLGRVRLPAPKPDARYARPSALPLRQTWQDGRFWPAGYTTRLH